MLLRDAVTSQKSLWSPARTADGNTFIASPLSSLIAPLWLSRPKTLLIALGLPSQHAFHLPATSKITALSNAFWLLDAPLPTKQTAQAQS